MSSPARLRFAPSPTGSLHIGNVRTALFNYLYAKHVGGTLVLRIEDTDQARSTSQALQTIYDGLNWLGITWDEGPIFQSRRIERHREVAQQLLDSGRAFERTDEGKGTAIVFKIDREVISWDDAIHGHMSRDLSKDPDIVIMKSDGSAAYNFACVVDDSDMKITHIVRGDDHIANTPKQISLFRALAQPVPIFAHIPLILNPDGSKMSKDFKKKNPEGKQSDIPTSLMEYKKLGFLPDALVNFMSLLGWAPGDDREIITREELIALFSFEQVNHGSSQFNIDKLTWMNGHYIRSSSLDEIVALTRPYLEQAFDLSSFTEQHIRDAVAQQHEKLKTLSEITDLTRFFFSDDIVYQEKAVQKILQKDGIKEHLQAAIEFLKDVPFEKEHIETGLKILIEKRNAKMKDIAQPIRVAVTGTTVSPPIHDTLHILGRERVLQRLHVALTLIDS